MKIVIDVPEKVYDRFCNCYRFPDEVEEAIIAITDGELLEQKPCEDAISRKAVLDILKDKWNMFSDANDAMQESIDTIESLRPVSSSENPKSEWQKDHEILKAYSDGANEVIDKIRERISLEKLGYPPSAGYYKAIVKVLQIIDGYKAESEAEE